MNDSYQAIYDAVRSKMSNCDVGSAIASAIREANIPHYVERAAHAVENAAACYVEPAAIYRPKVYVDGDQWCALYGDDLQSGVCGFGISPNAAVTDFNKNWYAKLPKKGE